MSTNLKQVVVCAANRSKITGRIICGGRHWDDVMRSHCVVDGQMLDEWKNAEQGFIDQRGVWMDRTEAYQVALAAGQVKYPASYAGPVLFSEDLY